MASRVLDELGTTDALRSYLSSSVDSSGALRLRSEIPAARSSLFSSGVAWVALDFMSAACIMTCALWLCGWWTGNHKPYGNASYCIAGVAFACFVLLLSRLSGLYTPGANRAEFRLLLRLLQCAVFATLGFYGFQSATGLRIASMGFSTAAAGVTVAAMLTSRMAWKRHRLNATCREATGRSFLIVGHNETGRGVRDYLCSLPFATYVCKGLIYIPGEQTLAE